MRLPIPQAIMQVFDRPPELGGSIANYPIVDYTVSNGPSRTELAASWYGIAGGGPWSRVDNFGDQISYENGWTYEDDVTSIQLTIGAGGWYVAPDILEEMGMSDLLDTGPYG